MTDLLKVRHLYLRGRKVKINVWEWTLFWVDEWREGATLCTMYVMYPVLIELCLKKRYNSQ
jgi:hypothetical protein